MTFLYVSLGICTIMLCFTFCIKLVLNAIERIHLLDRYEDEDEDEDDEDRDPAARALKRQLNELQTKRFAPPLRDRSHLKLINTDKNNDSRI